MSFNTVSFKSDGIHTDVALADFQDNNLVIITELKKIGLIFYIKKDTFYSLEGQEDIYSVHSVLGDEDPKALGAVRYLAERLKVPKNTVFCITLKDFSIPRLRLIADIVEKHKSW